MTAHRWEVVAVAQLERLARPGLGGTLPDQERGPRETPDGPWVYCAGNLDVLAWRTVALVGGGASGPALAAAVRIGRELAVRGMVTVCDPAGKIGAEAIGEVSKYEGQIVLVSQSCGGLPRMPEVGPFGPGAAAPSLVLEVPEGRQEDSARMSAVVGAVSDAVVVLDVGGPLAGEVARESLRRGKATFIRRGAGDATSETGCVVFDSFTEILEVVGSLP